MAVKGQVKCPTLAHELRLFASGREGTRALGLTSRDLRHDMHSRGDSAYA